MIQLKNISKSFSDKKVLDNINIEIKEGEFYLIKGESGKGKTTILNIIGMLEEFDEGELIIMDTLNPKIDKSSGRTLLKENISYLFQNYGLVDNETIKENLNMALKFKSLSKKKKEEAMKKALKRVKLDKELDTKIYTLSGGEQQRVALAKVILKDSKIILCDEPTGSLDEKNRDEILKILLELKNENKTIVMVSHDPIMENYVDTVYNL